MKIFLNYHDKLQAELDKTYFESENWSDYEKEQIPLEQMKEEWKKDREHYRYIYSKERDETFQEMIKKAIAIGQYYSFNVEVSYLEEDSDEEQIVLSGGIIHFSKEEQSWLDDLCWLFKTATESVIEGVQEKMVFIFWYRICEKEPKTDKPPEA